MPPGFDLIIMVLVFGLGVYFLMIRPQQKRMREHQAAISALQPGSRVLLTSGVFATIRHIGERQAIVELAPGTEVTIIKGNIARAVTDDEEEFEYSDDAPLVDLDSDEVVTDAAAGAEPFNPGPQDYEAAPQNFDPTPQDHDPARQDYDPDTFTDEAPRKHDN